MGNMLKKTAVLAMTGVLTLGSMTGCSKNLDGTKTVATVDKEDIQVGTLNFMVRYQQAQTAQMYAMYFGGGSGGIWSNVADEDTGETYGEQTVSEVLKDLETDVLLRKNAKDYKVTLPDDQKKKIQEAAKSFMEANEEATITKLGVDQSMVEEALELSYYKEVMFDPLTADVDVKISDEEAAQTGITMIKVANTASDASTEENTETPDPKKQAQQILDDILATADADMDALAKNVDENLNALDTSYTTNPAEGEEDTDTVPQEVQDAVKTLAEGEVYGSLLETDDAYYIVRLDATFDKDATEDKKTTIANDRKQTAYDDLIADWLKKADIEEVKKIKNSVKVTDNDSYSFKAADTQEKDAATESTGTDSTATDTTETDTTAADNTAE